VSNKDNNNIYSSYLIEARRLPSQKVEGLNEFITQIDDAKNAEVSYDLLMDLMDIIDKSGCPKIVFENLTWAYGLSTTTACILNTSVLRLSTSRMLYIILHEVAHQFQYTKHGEDFASKVYFGDEGLMAGANHLLKIEHTADRYAIRMTRYLLLKYDVRYNKSDLAGAYSHVTPASISGYIVDLRNQIKDLNLKDVAQVNELIYNTVKGKIAPPIYHGANTKADLDDNEKEDLQAELDDDEQDQLYFGMN